MTTGNRRQLLRWLCVAVPVVVLTTPSAYSAPAESGRPLIFGLITPRDPASMLASWTPFLQRIATEVGRSITPWAAPNAADLVAAFKSGQVDVAWVGNASALELVEAEVGEVFAQMVTAEGGTGYRSILVTHKDSGLRNLDDVQRPDKRLIFGDGDLNSTSGHLVPLYYAFVKRGINEPQSLFAAVRHDSHRNNLTAAARREVDVATANDVELGLFKSENAELASVLRVIWKSPTIPQSPLLWSTRLPLDLRRRLVHAVVTFGRRGTQDIELLRRINDLAGFRRSTNTQLLPVVDVQMFADWQQVNNDPDLSPGEKVARVEEISRRASRLELRLRLPPSVP
jgi:phosphonate transport system substrate-binding protein